METRTRIYKKHSRSSVKADSKVTYRSSIDHHRIKHLYVHKESYNLTKKEFKIAKTMEEKAKISRQDPERMNSLRFKFLEGVKKYFGVPYAKRYHSPDSPHYDSPLFLDCCGLIRRVLLDLKEDFGFVVGGGNQAYMFDTLPNDIENEEDMKPGDLVFITATYYVNNGKKWKKQRHDMVHVEVWLGDGEKTIGARWQKGVVQVFDSYKFVSKSYHSMKYHFKSIDTWLMGICKSYCSEHSWRKSQYNPGRKSIFAIDQQDDDACGAAAEEEESSSDVQQLGKEDCGNDEMSRRHDQSEGVFVLVDSKDSGENGHTEGSNSEVGTIENFVKTQTKQFKQTACKYSESNLEFNENSAHLQVYNARISTCKEEASQVLEMLLNTVETKVMQLKKCVCPECVPTRKYCPHTTLVVGDDEEANGACELSSHLSSSLECFDVISPVGCANDLDNAIVSCPIEKSKKTSGSSGSTSPSKDSGSGRDSGGSSPGDEISKEKNNTPRSRKEGTKSRMTPTSRQPTFYVSNGNGSSMVDATLVSMGWRRLEDKNDSSFKMKWVECKSQLDYNNFKEGEQLVNHISNIGLLTTKIGLLSSLQEYVRVLDKVGSRQRITLSDFVPETYALTNQTEKERFANSIYQEGEIWICKPIGQNQGKGIYIVNSSAQLREKLKLNGQQQNTDGRRISHVRPPQGRVIQRYITNPLLLNGFKFDVRTYMFIASTRPYIVLYHPGYIRVSCVPYSPYSTESSTELHAHLTNQYVQKKHPLFSSMKEETVWSFERAQAYIDEHHTKEKQLPENWLFTTFTKRMQQIMLTCFHSVRKKLHRRHGYFDLLGFDFMIDENFKVWLIEINVNPSLSTSCQVLKDLMPNMVDNTIKLALELFEKSMKKKPIFPLENLGRFQLLYNGEGKG
ncbi:uncharacterized protein LOC5512073 isoform X2 [Nematostella vectensis]|uniref:uncharacterized protein LOC5512073 isoform X2 n=1 Tax=Nematostella vectensis TaxID=45351 RepID=UPI0013906C96|nr:uncharacterized protein LOC5512073 isoform X2 [Nematostella vectensis]